MKTHKYLSFFLASLFLFFEMTIQVSPNAIASILMKELSINALELGFMSSLYFYSYAAMMIPVGLLFDRISIRMLLPMAIGVLSLGTFVFSLGTSVLALGLGRCLMGFGSAFAFIGALVVAQTSFSRKFFPFLVGLIQLMAATGAILGESPVAFIVEHIGWRGAFQLFTIAGIVLLILVVFFVRAPGQLDHKIEGSHSILQSIKSIFSNRQMYFIALYGFCSWGPITTYASLWGIPYISEKYSISATMAGLSPTAVWIAMAIYAPLMGRFVHHISHKRLLSISALIGLVGSTIVIYYPHLNFTLLLIFSLLIGIGSTAQILTFDLAHYNNPKKQFGIASGFTNAGLTLSGALLQPLIGLLMHHGSTSHKYTIHDYESALWVIPSCFIVCFTVSQFFIKYDFKKRN